MKLTEPLATQLKASHAAALRARETQLTLQPAASVPAPATQQAPRGAVPPTRRISCQVAGCTALDGSAVRRFNARARCCEAHAAAPEVQLAGGGSTLSRLCVRCAEFHRVDQFDGKRRYCLASQTARNERRRVVYARHRADRAAASPTASEPSAAAVSDTSAALDGIDAPCFNEDDLQIALALGLTDARSPAHTPPLAGAPMPLFTPLEPLVPPLPLCWQPQAVTLKFPTFDAMALPPGLAGLLREVLCASPAGADSAALLEGWVSPGCTLLRCDVAPVHPQRLRQDAAGVAAALMATASTRGGGADAALRAQPFTLTWQGCVAVVAAGGAVVTTQRPPPPPRLPPPLALAVVAGAAARVALATPAVAGAPLQCRFHGRFLCAMPPATPEAALQLPALPTPGCALLEYAPFGAGPFAAPRPLLVCPSAAIAAEVNSLARSDATEALLRALGAALRPECPLALAAAAAAVAAQRGWSATLDALLPALRASYDAMADASGDAAAQAALDSALRHRSLTHLAAAGGSHAALAAVLAAGGAEAAFGAADDIDDAEADDATLPRASASETGLPPAMVRQALLCYGLGALCSALSMPWHAAGLASTNITPELLAAAMPWPPASFAHGVYRSRVRIAQPASGLLCLLGVLLAAAPPLRRVYARVHTPLLVCLFIFQLFVVPILGSVLAAREWGFGAQLPVPLWSGPRILGWLFAMAFFAAAFPIPPRLHAVLLAARAVMPLTAYADARLWAMASHPGWVCLHALLVGALAAYKWRAAAAHSAAQREALAARKRA